MIEVSYRRAHETSVHRHDAHAFVYVLEGRSSCSEGPTYVTLTAEADVLRGSYRCSRRGAQRQQQGAGQVRRGAAEGQGAPILTPVKEDSHQ